MDKEIGYEDVDWTHLVQNRIQWRCCEHGNDRSGCIRGELFLDSQGSLFFNE
jgi:hypothetical protein